MLNNEYCKRVYEQILARDPDQKEFHQAVYEVLEGLLFRSCSGAGR